MKGEGRGRQLVGVVGGSQGIANIIVLYFQIGPNIMATTHTQHLPMHFSIAALPLLINNDTGHGHRSVADQ